MALAYRALLIPTAALDSSGRAKPNAVFSVTPIAGGSPVAVYGAAQGGSALGVDQIKTDVLGNISGLYVAEPGPYTLSFTGGGTVVTSAVMDSRDVATSSDLADGLAAASGGSLELADYAYDADTDVWTVQPNATPGTAMFTAQEGLTTNQGGGMNVSFNTTIANDRVATLDPANPTQIVIATTGMYLAYIFGQFFSGDWGTEWTDQVEITFNGAFPGPLADSTGTSPSASVSLQSCVPVLLKAGWVCGLNVNTSQHAWQVRPLTRVMLIRLT